MGPNDVSKKRASPLFKPYLALTLGDPAGVGPWCAVAAALDHRVSRRCRPLLVGDAWVLHRFLAHRILRLHAITDPQQYRTGRNIVNILHVPHPAIRTLVLGRPQRVGGESAYLSLRTAAALAVQKRVLAMVTGPISKTAFDQAGVPCSGHTELLSDWAGTKDTEMLMAAGPLRALLVTRHIPLKDVPRRLSPARRAGRWRWFSQSDDKKECGLHLPHSPLKKQ